ncbi:RhoGAP domain-containing protein [Apiospora arundinis]|uniref:RhoGAP domain-containing protein n=1 Tax=Apiospora arundinis TaxID=335852 RepID=A0ABR2I3X5_9PEZI
MQPYKHDTEPPSLRAKGKAKAVLAIGEPQPPRLVPFPRQATASRPRISRNTFSRPHDALVGSQTAGNIGISQDRDPAAYRSSTTWTSSSGDCGINSEDEEVEDRVPFLDEYNKLAKKHGIRMIVPGDFTPAPEHQEPPPKSLPERKNNWISRVLRQTSNGQPTPDTTKPSERLQHRRSISDIALNFVYNQRKAALKHEDLRGLVRLCGKSTLYLPAEYAPGSLILPTCFRATAQYLIQHADSQGMFRIPGSVRIVNALYDYYLADERNEEIATTTRCPNLPTHLNCSVHDVASTFKRFLSGLPGGILGSLSLFDALVAIHSQLHAEPESTKTKDSKLRARLIALAIGTVNSRYRRELICAVFGILCLVGRVAELAPREDAKGRPLPTFDLMGYNSLAIIFGPLLVGDLINFYSTKVADPAAGLVLLPVTPPKSKKQKWTKVPKDQMPSMPTIDRIHVANDITEMLIVHWREVVRHLRSMSVLHSSIDPLYSGSRVRRNLRNSSASETFSMRMPPDWSTRNASHQLRSRSNASLAASPTPSSKVGPLKARMKSDTQMEPLSIRRQRLQTSSSAALHRLPRGQSLNALSPTAEESPLANHNFDDLEEFDPVASSTPKRYKSRIGKGLGEDEFAKSNEELGLQSRGFLGDPMPGTSVASSSMPASRMQHSKTLNEIETSMRNQPFYENPHELDVEKRFNSPAMLRGQSEKQRTLGATSRQELTSSRDSKIQLRAPSAGKTPLKYERLPSVEKAATDLPQFPTEGQNFTPEQQIQSEEKLDNMNDAGLTRATHPTDALQPIPSESEEISPLSGVETFPSFHKSVVENPVSPPEQPPSNGKRSKKKTEQAPGKNMSSDKSSPWSLRHFLGRKSPSAGRLNKNPEPLTDGAPAKRSSPIARWRELVKNSPTSPLATLREKRLFRGAGRGSPHESAESNESVEKKAVTATPEWKRKLLNKKLEHQKKPPTLSPDKKLIFEQSPQSSLKRPNLSPAKGTTGSPAKGAKNMTNRPVSQRSSSRPVGGAVKAMAAMFDSASIDSPDGPKPPLTSRSRSDLRSSASFASGHAKTQSPAKSTKPAMVPSTVTPQTPSKTHKDDPRGVGLASGKTYRTSVGRKNQSTTEQSPQDTPSRFPNISLRPTGFVFSASREEPKASPSKAPHRDREISRPPSLGTMVPPREEPPVAHHLNFARPPSAASSLSHLSAHPPPPEGGDNPSIAQEGIPLPATEGSPRTRSGNGLLYAQIRALHRQLQLKNEEVLHLRRQLETRENMDIGTLSERLREARRDCAMWRDRAEAAEKRIAVFEKFAAKARALRSDTSINHEEREGSTSKPATQSTQRVTLGDEESDGTEHTEDHEAFNNRLRRSMKQQGTTPAEDGAMSTPTDEEPLTLGLNVDRFLEDTDYMPLTWRGRELRVAAEELLDMQDEMESQPLAGPSYGLAESD